MFFDEELDRHEISKGILQAKHLTAEMDGAGLPQSAEKETLHPAPTFPLVALDSGDL